MRSVQQQQQALWLQPPGLMCPQLMQIMWGALVPEATQMLPVAHGMDLCPVASCDAYGNEAFVHTTVNRQMTERMGKALASASFGLVGQATLLHQAKKLKPFMLMNTLSNAFKVGQAIRQHQGNQ